MRHLFHDNWRETWRGIAARPFIVGALSLAAGIALAEGFPALLSWPGLHILIVVWLAVLLVASRFSYTAFLALAMAGCFLLGYAAYVSSEKSTLEASHIARRFAGQRTEVEGVVDVAPEHGQRAVQLSLAVERCRLSKNEPAACTGKLLVFVADKRIPWQAGDRVRLVAKLRDAWNAGNPGEFNYARYLVRRGYYVTAWLRKAESVEIVERPAIPASLSEAIERLRGKLAAWIETNIDSDNAEMLKALTLGMGKGLPDDVRQSYQRSGTAHLLAISGLHLGVIALWLFVIVRRLTRFWPSILRRVGAEQAAAAVTLPLTWGYALLAGLHFSTQRSAVMITVYLLAKLLWRQTEAFYALFIAAFLILMANPSALFDIGFQLSFISVLAIVIGVPRLEASLPERWRSYLSARRLPNRAVSYLAFVLMSSLVCFCATLPVTARAFNQFSWIGLAANLVAVPIFSLAVIPMLAAIVGTWLIGFSGVGPLLALPSLLLAASQHFQDWLLTWTAGVILVPRLPWLFDVLYYGGLIALVLGLPSKKEMRGRPESGLWDDRPLRRRRRAAALLLLSAAAILAWAHSAGGAPDETAAYIPHLADGTSVVVRFADGRVETFSPGRAGEDAPLPGAPPLAKTIWSFGMTSIDRLWMTSRSPAEDKAAERLQEFINVRRRMDVGADYRCEPQGPLERCRERQNRSPLVWIWRRRGNPHLAAWEIREKERALLVVPSPHKIPAEFWAALKVQSKAATTSIVWFGPGQAETFAAMIDALNPRAVVLAMNRRLARFLPAKDWSAMRQRFPAVHRTDRQGAAALKTLTELEPLANSWRDDQR
ncbi:MAG: ComEC family competence protein [Myxococcales bacterium]|nr:MAG: ComEC family competence protein [Myxococcales bacterium]